MGLLDGQRAIVTGGGSGIGEATARLMAAEGAVVSIFDINATEGTRVASEIAGHSFELNVIDTDAVQAATDAAVEAMGGLTTVFNNAGIGNVKAMHTYTEKEWDLLVGVNQKGTFNGIRAAIPHLRTAGGGCIVNMASVSGVTPTRGEAPYAAAKAATIALTQSAALEYGPEGIRVNCVSPGFIRTNLTEFAFGNPVWADPIAANTPLGRAGTAEDVAKVVVFLCSDLAGYMTGQNLLIDGGSVLTNSQVDHMLTDLLGG